MNETRYNIFNLDDAKNEARVYFKMYTKRAALYDEQTNHGLIIDKQKEWNEVVAAELTSLNEFENTIY